MNTPEPPVPSTPLPDDDGRIEKMLRESSQRYLDDAGFTARIMSALPPPRRRAERRRNVLLLGAAVLGCGLAAGFGVVKSVAFLVAILERLVAWTMLPVPGLGTALTVGMLICSILTLLAGWRAWERLRSSR